MTTVVPIEPGQWALAWNEHCFHDDDDCAGDPIQAAALRLKFRGAGWEHLRAGQLFEVHRVSRVMPKTYMKASPYSGSGHRAYRDLVIATGATELAMTALRDELFAIGHETDDAIEWEAARLVSEFAAKTRADAVEKIHALLPHIFPAVTDAQRGGVGTRA